MLDNEVKRLKEENWNLQQTIQRADNILYGSKKPNAAGSNKENLTGNARGPLASPLTRRHSGKSAFGATAKVPSSSLSRFL